MKLTKWKLMGQEKKRVLKKFAFLPTKIYQGATAVYDRSSFFCTASCWIWMESFQSIQWRLDSGCSWHTLVKVATDWKDESAV